MGVGDLSHVIASSITYLLLYLLFNNKTRHELMWGHNLLFTCTVLLKDSLGKRQKKLALKALFASLIM